ncbi:MAG TPA: hypothetical protein VHP31_11365 [Caproicibacter sp.]|nr:hypothetical protein [Caproicibacter sp.]
MKACIVEIRGSHAAALVDNGRVIKIRNRNYSVGQVIALKQKLLNIPAKALGLTAAAAAVIMFFGIGAWAYFTPYTYVSLDVNPSIEYSVNRFDRVLSAKAVDNDGTEILNGLSLNNQTIEQAVEETVDKIESKGYFQPDDPGDIVISTSSDDTQAAAQLADELKTTAEDAVKSSGSEVEVEAISVGRSRVLEAQKLGTTPGKLNLVQKLQASAPDSSTIDVQEWLKKPVKEIMKAIKANRKQPGVSTGQGGNTAGNTNEDTAGQTGDVSWSQEAETTQTSPAEELSPRIGTAGSSSSKAPEKSTEKPKTSASRPSASKPPKASENNSKASSSASTSGPSPNYESSSASVSAPPEANHQQDQTQNQNNNSNKHDTSESSPSNSKANGSDNSKPESKPGKNK